MRALIQELVEAYGPSGNESGVRELIRAHVEPLCDECRVDALGNLIALKRGDGSGLKVMLAAHMDEIGLIVSHVDANGFLRFGTVGGVRTTTVLGGRVLFANGVQGTIGQEHPKSSSDPLSFDTMFIDVGAASREALTVGVGDVACFQRPMVDLGDRLMAKAMDDRIGCAVLIQALRDLEATPHDVYFVFTVQEELGLRGAQTSAYGVAPDVGIAVDVIYAGDTPEPPHMNMVLGGGPCIKVKDGGMLSHPGVKDLLIEVAERQGIPYQLEVALGGTTDAKAMQVTRAGVAAGAVSVSTRYIHTPSEMVHYADVVNSAKLLTAVLSGPINLGG